MLLTETQEPTFRLKSLTTPSKEAVGSDAQAGRKEPKAGLHDLEAL